jgi:hypothetical protein
VPYCKLGHGIDRFAYFLLYVFTRYTLSVLRLSAAPEHVAGKHSDRQGYQYDNQYQQLFHCFSSFRIRFRR